MININYRSLVTPMRPVLMAVVAGCFCVAMTGCGPSEPTMFGVPESKYKTMSRAQQDAAIRQYNQQQAQAKKDETAWNVLGGIASVFQTKKTVHRSNHSSCQNTGPGSRECHSSSSSASIGFG